MTPNPNLPIKIQVSTLLRGYCIRPYCESAYEIWMRKFEDRREETEAEIKEIGIHAWVYNQAEYYVDPEFKIATPLTRRLAKKYLSYFNYQS